MRRTFLLCAMAMFTVSTASAGPLSEASVDLRAYVPQQERTGQDPTVAIAVAVSGGGLRAGNYGLGVLLGLEEVKTTHGNLLAEVDYFSTISGGGFTAGAYVSSRHDHVGPDVYSLADAVAAGTPLRAALLDGYTGRMFGHGCEVYRVSRHRGHALEKLLDDRVLGADTRQTSLVLGDLWHRAGTPVAPEKLLPYWVANAAIVENGAVFPFAPDVLARARVDGFVHRCKDEVIKDPFEMPLSVGMKASASFPGGVPGTVLHSGLYPHRPYVRLTDGGVSDNQGIVTAIELLLAEPSPVARRVLVVVDAYRGDDIDEFSDEDTPPSAAVELGRAVYLMKAAQRLNYARLVGHLCRAAGIGFVYLDLSAVPSAALQAKVRDISTGFSLTRDEQDDLIEAGRTAVASHLGALRAAGVPQ